MAADTIMGPVHPGEILLEEFLKPLGISQYQLAKEIGAQSAPHGVRPGRGDRSASGSVCGPEGGVAPRGPVLATGVDPGLSS